MQVPRFFSLVCIDAVIVPHLPESYYLEIKLGKRIICMQRMVSGGAFMLTRHACGKQVYVSPVFATADLPCLTMHAVDMDDGERLKLPVPTVDTHAMLLGAQREFASPGVDVSVVCRPVYKAHAGIVFGRAKIAREVSARGAALVSPVTTHLEHVFASAVGLSVELE